MHVLCWLCAGLLPICTYRIHMYVRGDIVVCDLGMRDILGSKALCKGSGIRQLPWCAPNRSLVYNVDSLGMVSSLRVALEDLERDSLHRVVPWQLWRHRLGRTEYDREIASEGNNLGLRQKERHLCRSHKVGIWL